MSKAKHGLGLGTHSFVTLAGTLVALSALLTVTACGSTGGDAIAGNTLGTGGAPSQSPSNEPGTPTAGTSGGEPTRLDAATRAFIASQQAKPRPDTRILDAHAEQAQSVARAGHVPAFDASNKVLDLPVPSLPTTYPLSATTPVLVPIVSSSASSSYDGRRPPTASYDGDTTTFWMTAGNAPTEGKDYMPWIQYTFDQVYSLGTMRVINFDGYEYLRGAKDVEVLVSQDGTTFTSLGYKLFLLGSSTTIDGTPITTGATWQSFDLGGASAKSVKLAIHTNYYGGAFYGSPAPEVPFANASITGLREVQFYADLPVPPPSLTTYPLSPDGKYYTVNLLNRNFLPPTANATFSSGVSQLGAAAPPLVFDGKDAAFSAVTATPGDPNSTVTLTVDMGQYFSIGAVRPMYQVLGGPDEHPLNQRIRLATKLGPKADWQTVADAPTLSTDTTLSFDATPARFLELTMHGNACNLLELFVYPSAQTSPPPTYAGGYDITSLASTQSVNENFCPIGQNWPVSWPAGGFYPKNLAGGGKGDAVATIDLGTQFPISRVSLGFFWGTPWVNGGRLELGSTPDTFATVADSGLGHDFFPWPNTLDFNLPTRPVRYIRATDYFTPSVGLSGQVLWSVHAFATPPPHVGYFPLSADGKYFAVNLIRRPVGDVQPTASVVYSNGALAAPLPWDSDPNHLVDGDDGGFAFVSPSANMPDAAATLTVDLGQVQKLGAVRPIFAYPPVSSSIRIAPTLDGPWHTVLDGPVTTIDVTTSFDGFDARYVELTMKGTTTNLNFANIYELMAYPSSETDPAPGSGSHLDLSYLTGMSVTTNPNMGQNSGPRLHSFDGVGGIYVKTTAQGATGDATATIDLGQLFQVSQLDLAFFDNQVWPDGGKVDVSDGTDNWVTVFDTGRGSQLGPSNGGLQAIAFRPYPARYVRLTGYVDPNLTATGLIENMAVFGDSMPCAPSCTGKTCGGDIFDGCGHLCPGLCGPGGYCTSNFDCASSYICAQRSADPSAAHVCVAQNCTSACTTECPCAAGSTSSCSSVAQCASRLSCTDGLCQPGTNSCHDGVRDGDESDVDCGGSCAPCNAGKICTADTDCPSDQVCGEGNGACFGRSRAERVCWKPACSDDNLAAGCGDADSACGQNCACANSCDTTGSEPSHCAAGEVCTKGLGSIFNAPTPDVCLDARCPSNDPALCGTPASVCGPQCVCTSKCSTATCDNPSDGCGGICPGVCQNGQTCTEDVECPSGGACIEDALGVPRCRPSVCAFRTLAPPLCGTPGATCGDQCPTCAPRCDGRQCGTDPNCGQSCGTCSAGAFCDANGQCVNATVPKSLHVPDGNDGQRDLPDLPQSETSTVGALKGQFAVSDEGSPQYTIPIEVPPGRAGMEPAVSLNYSGSHLNGDEGVGWHVEGLSKITRCPRSNALDGYAAAIRNDNTDRFCIDGKRLEIFAGTYGEDGAEYRTLIDSFAKVISHSEGSGIQVDPLRSFLPVPRGSQGPDWFQVWTKDGRILTYGRTQDSLMFGRNGVRFAWLINRVEDRSGNTILVRYDSLSANLPNALKAGFPNVIHPRTIAYTGHGGTAGNRSVQFFYDDNSRPDRQLSFFQGGVPFASYQRLKRITTYVNDVPVKSYKLKYGGGTQSQIQSIFECADGDDNAGEVDPHCKQPTSFTYTEESGFDPGTGFTDLNMSTAGQLDANGDGIPDFLATRITVDGVDSSPTLAAAQIATDVAIGIASSYLSPAGYVAVNVAWNLVKGPFWGLFGSDPKIEVLRKMRIGTGNRPDASIYIDTVTGIPCDASKNPSFFLDYDQDGKDDIVSACGPRNRNLYVARSLASPGAGCPNCGSFQNFPSADPVLDGVVNSTSPSPTTTRSNAAPPPVKPDPVILDVNGDSLQDVVTCQNEYTLNLWLRQLPAPGAEKQPFSQGFATKPITIDTPTPFQPPPINGHPQSPVPRALLDFCGQPRPTFNIFDVDGDGTPNLLVRGQNGWVMLRYEEVANVPRLSWQPVTFSDVGGKDGSIGGNISLGDFNGDGLSDVWNVTDDKVIIWLNTGAGLFTAKYLDRPRPALSVDPRFSYRKTGLIDYNADGQSDLLENWQYTEQVSGGIDVNNSNTALLPNSTVDFLAWTGVPEIRAKNLYDVYFPQSIDQTADIDGDGNVDVFNDDGLVFFGRGARNTLLKSVIDGLGNTVTVEYNSSAYSSDEACAGVTWPEKCLPRMTGIVSSHSEGFAGTFVSGTERTYNYNYKNARMNVTGHGWLGFDQRSVTMTGANVSTTTTVDYEPNTRYGLDGTPAPNTSVRYIYPFAGLPKQITVVQHAQTGGQTPPLQSGLFDRKTETVNSWSVKLSSANRPFPAVTFRDVSTYDIPLGIAATHGGTLPGDQTIPPLSGQPSTLLTECTDGFTEDKYGNVTYDDRECQVRDGTGLEYSLTDTGFDIDETSWLISNPEHVNVQSANLFPVPESLRRTHFTYQNGLLATAERLGTTDQQQKTTYFRNAFGNVWHITDEAPGQDPRDTAITYDEDDIFPKEILNAEGQTTQIAFDPKWGVPKAVVDGNGVASQVGYDGFGRTTVVSGPSGTAISTYATVSQPITNTAAGTINPKFQVSVERQGTEGTHGGTDSAEYDNHGRAVRTTSTGLGGTSVVQEQAYNGIGQLIGQSRPHAASTPTTSVPYDQYSYDSLQRLTRIGHGVGTTINSSKQYQYASIVSLDRDAHGQWLNGMTCPGGRPLAQCVVEFQLSQDEEGHQDVVVSDYRGRVIRNIDGENIETAAHSSNYIYAAAGPLAQARDNGGLLTKLDYDNYGRLIRRTDPDVGDSAYTYTGFDELNTSTDPKQQFRIYSHDVMGRTITVADAGGLKTRWDYDLGRLVDTFSPKTDDNPDGQHIHYNYEPATPARNRGFLEDVTYTLDGTDYLVKFKYDDLGRSDHVEYPDLGTGQKVVVQSKYDQSSGALNGLDQVVGSSSKSLWHITDSFQGYLVQQETFGSGASTATSSYVYDPKRHWLQNIQTTLGNEQIQSIAYTHYDNGLVQTVNTVGLAPREYLYDPLNRLRFANDTPEQGLPVSTAYSYDSIGNLTGRGSTVTVPRATQPHLIDHVGDNVYGYDLNGNVTSRVGPDVPHHSQSIDYTPFDLPKSVVSGLNDPTGPATTVNFEYSADEERVVRRDPDSVRYFVGDLYQRKVDTQGATLEERFQISAGGRQIGEIVRTGGADKALFFQTDHLGSPDTISDSDGAAFHERFDPFGLPVDSPNPELTRVGFTGQAHDNDLGLIDMKGRIYDPLAGRFTSPDPVTQSPFWSQGLNRYSYVFNNPVNYTDPSGFTANGTDFGTGMTAWGASVVGLAAAQGSSSVAGSVGGSFLSGLGSAGLGAGANVGISLLGGGYGGGKQPSRSFDAPTPSSTEGGNGVSKESPPAMTQNKRRPGPPPGRLAQEEKPEGDDLEPIEDTVLKNLERELSDAERTGEVWHWGHLADDPPDTIGPDPAYPQPPEVEEHLEPLPHLPFKPFTRSNFRYNLRLLKGADPGDIEDMDAHHLFPRKFDPEFSQRFQLNIHDPRLGEFWNSSAHRAASNAYNRDFETHLNLNVDFGSAMDFVDGLRSKYGL